MTRPEAALPPADPAEAIAYHLNCLHTLMLRGAGPAPAPHPDYLCSWRSVLAAVGKPNSAGNRRALRRLNEMHAGPVLLPGKGGQPQVSLSALRGWWASLEGRLAELRQRQVDRAAATAADVGRHVRRRAA